MVNLINKIVNMLYKKIDTDNKNHKIKTDNQEIGQAVFSIGRDQNVTMLMNIDNIELLSSDEINNNSEVVAKMLYYIAYGPICDSIKEFIDQALVNSKDDPQATLFFQNMNTYYNLYIDNRNKQLKEKLYDRIVVKPSEVFHKYVQQS
jgi:hypothetical protein